MSTNKTGKPVEKNTENENTDKKKPEENTEFTPKRFSVRGLRKHTEPKTSRNPKGIR